MTKGNGKPKRKNGRPKSGEQLSKKLILAEAVKADGAPVKMAVALGVTPQTADRHLDNPTVKKAVLDARARALKRAGITLEKTFCKIGKNLRKQAGPDMRHAIDKSLHLLGEGETAQGPQSATIIMPLIVVNGSPFRHEFLEAGGNGKPHVPEV